MRLQMAALCVQLEISLWLSPRERLSSRQPKSWPSIWASPLTRNSRQWPLHRVRCMRKTLDHPAKRSSWLIRSMSTLMTSLSWLKNKMKTMKRKIMIWSSQRSITLTKLTRTLCRATRSSAPKVKSRSSTPVERKRSSSPTASSERFGKMAIRSCSSRIKTSNKPSLAAKSSISSPKLRLRRRRSRTGYKSSNSRTTRSRSTSQTGRRRSASLMAPSSASLQMVKRKAFSQMARFKKLKRLAFELSNTHMANA